MAAWPTPQAQDTQRTPEAYAAAKEKRGGKMFLSLNIVAQLHGLPAPANPSTYGSHQGSWATPTTCNAPEAVNWETFNGQYFRKMDGRKHQTDLSLQVKGWATPQAKDHKSGHRDPTIVQYKQLNVEVEAKATGKLNPRWVETLMGLPVGWTMPSCTRPVTIELTNCDSSATESCQQPQSEHSEFF
jgi:hypothetical protein